jgi:hypothetical protein
MNKRSVIVAFLLGRMLFQHFKIYICDNPIKNWTGGSKPKVGVVLSNLFLHVFQKEGIHQGIEEMKQWHRQIKWIRMILGALMVDELCTCILSLQKRWSVLWRLINWRKQRKCRVWTINGLIWVVTWTRSYWQTAWGCQ